MPWDSVPWFTEGGAEHSSEVARLLAYSAFGGAEGIVGAGDLQVRALSSPAAAIRVTTGACAILNRAPGASYQAYAGRMPTSDQVSIAATGVSARSDLIIARIENPYAAGEPWANPSNPKVGPYIYTRVISNVPKTTTSVRQVRPNDSAITLARIDIPANTSSITQAMIKDLREMGRPRRDRRLYTASPSGDENWGGNGGSWVKWPPSARWSVEVPSWATKARIVMNVAGTQVLNGGIWCASAWQLGSSIQGQSVQIDTGASDRSERIHMISADTRALPSSYRGTVQELSALIWLESSEPGVLQADVATTAIADVEWVEDPYEDET
ncbi:hypothetical protein EF903_01715 [Streptomyces sp. WAC05292]|uniref:hypothetical protein n=1 Tax=Streptomyces sp. WAC05292 TaxID=2487418 RepID=UPI000F743985|nr:hypothetical protein [Streptomyces sp. WAC05292]RSS97264.1 hypothetical protein EF903_01715 [Streptomyces sp. WAC05292]